MAAVAAGDAEEANLLNFYLFDAHVVAQATWRQEELKPNVWRRLQEELLEIVLLWLPASSQARFRVVSKDWLKLLTSKSFRERSAELAFFGGQHICGVSQGKDEDAMVNSRQKVHKLSLDFLPSEFQHQSYRDILYQKSLILLTVYTAPASADGTGCRIRTCVVNPINQSWFVLPETHNKWYGFSVLYDQDSRDGKILRMRVYAESDESHNNPMVGPARFWNMYDRGCRVWTVMKFEAVKTIDLATVVARDYLLIASIREDGVDIIMYRHNGVLEHRYPSWRGLANVRVKFWVRANHRLYPVALAFLATEDSFCEVWRAGVRSKRWEKLAVMPPGFLRPLGLDGSKFFTPHRVEVVGNVAYISLVTSNRPMYTRKAWRYFLLESRVPAPEEAILVAFDVGQRSWKIECDRWLFNRRHMFQPHPKLNLSRREDETDGYKRDGDKTDYDGTSEDDGIMDFLSRYDMSSCSSDERDQHVWDESDDEEERTQAFLRRRMDWQERKELKHRMYLDESDEGESDEGESDEGESDEGESDEGESDEGESHEDWNDDEDWNDEGESDEDEKDEGDNDEGESDEGESDEGENDEGERDEGESDEGESDEGESDEDDSDYGERG